MHSPNLQPGSLNHLALSSADLELAAHFYCNVLGFHLVPRPSFSFDGRWLYRAQVGPMLHLIYDAEHVVPTVLQ